MGPSLWERARVRANERFSSFTSEADFRLAPPSGVLLAALVGLLLVGMPAIAPAQEDISVQGEILDMTCYLHSGSKGRRHRACAQMCAEKGLPIGVLTDSGDVYLLIENHENPESYAAAAKLAGQKAAIKGKKYSKGSVSAIMVTEAKNP